MRPILLLLLCMLTLHGLRAQGTGQQLMVTTNLVRLLPLMNGEGLSSSRITCIVQDKQGYIWFGTEDGLNRYNGQTIKVFRHIPGDSNSLSSNSISRMIVDQQGLLWITSKGNGLNCYNPITGTFKVYRHEANNLNSLPSNGVHCLLQSRKGEIWIGADNGGGLIRFDPYRKIFKSYLLWPDTAHSVENRRYNSVQYILEDKDSTLWLGARDGLYHFNPRTEAFKVYRDKPESKDHYLENLIFTIHQDGDDSLWLGYWGGGLKLFNKRLGQYQKTYRYVPQKELNGHANMVLGIMPKSASEMWVSTHDNGLALFNKQTEQFHFIKADPVNPHNVYPIQTSYLYQDQTGILWVGTFEGVYYINPYAKAFQSLQLPGATEVGTHNKVVASYVYGNTLYIGALASKGLYVYNSNTTAWHTLPVTKLPHDIKEVIKDRYGKFWVSTSLGVFQLDTLKKNFKLVFPPANSPPAYRTIRFTSLLEDRRGDIWMGTEVNGLFKYNRSDGSFTHYRPEANDDNSLAGFAILALLEDGEGTIWVATSDGLSRYNPLTKRFTNFLHDPKRLNGLPARQVSSLVQDNAGSIWIGTDEGLSRLSLPKEGKHVFTLYTIEDGLPANRIYRLVKDKRGRIWMGTAKGLSCFYPHQAAIRFCNFDQRDGLVQDHLNNELYVSETGHILIGFAGSLTSFHPDSLLALRPAAPFTIYSLKIFDKEAALDSTIELKKRVQLEYDENFFTLSFSVLQYINPKRNQYRYQLEGYDNRWNNAGNRGYATYTKVPPGEYIFRVKSTNNYLGGNEQERTIRIIILPPWWNTWWAYMGYGLLAAAALLLGRREVVKRERLRADLRVKQVESQKWQELDAMKSRFFANISHEFRTPLTLILGTSDELLEQLKQGAEYKQQYELIKRNAQRLLRLINQLMDLSRLEAGRLQLETEPNSITHFLNTIVQSFSSLADRRGIDYRLHLPKQDHWALFDRDKLEKIFVNLLSNALKFTPTGGVVAVTATVELVTDPPAYRLAVTVADTGIGIAPEQLLYIFDRFYQGDNSTTRSYEGSGIGLALAKELTELYGGEITVESTPGEGTTFRVVLTLPLAQVDEQTAAVPPVLSKPLVAGEPGKKSPVEVSETDENNQAAENEPYQTKVLVVEDDADLRRYLCKHLSREYAVLEAENGAAGWGVALETLPDLVVSDVMMPQVDGLTLCQRLKQHTATAHIPVVLLTARAEREDKIGGLLIGADDYLTKPFHVQELMVRAHNLIEARKKLRELFHREVLLHPEEAKVPSADDIFLKRVIEVIHQHMGNDQFGLEELCRKVGLSRTQLYRKVFALTSQGPSDFIRTLRLRQAASLLRQRAGNVSEIAYRVGFKEASTFSKAFSKEFGCPPSEYAQKQVL